MNVLNEDGQPREGISITCPECGQEVNLEYSPGDSQMEDNIFVCFNGECACGVSLIYERYNPGEVTTAICVQAY